MTKINTDKLNEDAYITRLDNHLTVFVIKKPDFRKKVALLGVNYGSVNLTFDLNGQRHETPAGVAHFLEHKLFDMPDGSNVLRQYSQMGASPNAFTSSSATAYHFECTENFDNAFKLLFDCVFTPYFTPQSVEKERGIIDQEISMYRDMPAARLHNELMPMLYSSHPVRHSVLGTHESIAEITDKTLFDCYNAFYQPTNMVLTVAGDVDPEAIEKAASRFSPSSSDDIPVSHIEAADEITDNEKVIDFDVPQPMFLIGVKLPMHNHSLKWELLCKLAVDSLAGPSTELYGELYNSDLIDSSFNMYPYFFKGGGILAFSGRSRDPLAVRDALRSNAARLYGEGVNTELFERLKRAEWGERVRSLDNLSEITRAVSLDYMSGTDFFSLPQAFEALNTAELREVFKCMETMSIVQCRRK